MRNKYGMRAHEILRQKAIEKLRSQGYEFIKESIINGNYKVDILAIKGNEKVGLECQLRVVSTTIEKKIKVYFPHLDRLIFYIPESKSKQFKKVMEKLRRKNVEVWTEKIKTGARILLYIDDDLEEKFREKARKHYSGAKGYLTNALEDAITMWLKKRK